MQQEDGFCATRRSVHCTVLAWGDTTLVSAPAQQLDGFRWVERGGPTTCDGPIKCMAQYSDNAESVWAGGCSEGEAYRWQNKLSRSLPTNKPDPSWSLLVQQQNNCSWFSLRYSLIKRIHNENNHLCLFMLVIPEKVKCISYLQTRHVFYIFFSFRLYIAKVMWLEENMVHFFGLLFRSWVGAENFSAGIIKGDRFPRKITKWNFPSRSASGGPTR